ncbi:MAG: hypothetical protein E6J41_17310 [Chloroflexi bacterium]|nr:MAG: hypothetical protein E6J41_17310 [Chloroflexota bacterium]
MPRDPGGAPGGDDGTHREPAAARLPGQRQGVARVPRRRGARLRPLADAEPQEVVVGGLPFREVVSVTQIAGGVASNVVPDRVVCGLNFRYAGHRTPAAAEERLRELVGSAGELTVLSNAASAPVAVDNPLLRRLRAAGDLAVEPKQAWTPVAEFAARGLDAVNLGPGDPQFAHRRDERVGVQAMSDTLSVLRRFLSG